MRSASTYQQDCWHIHSQKTLISDMDASPPWWGDILKLDKNAPALNRDAILRTGPRPNTNTTVLRASTN